MKKLYFYWCFCILSSMTYAQEDLKKTPLENPASLEMKEKMRMKLDLPDFRWESPRYRIMNTMEINDFLNIRSYPVNEKTRLRIYNSGLVLPGLMSKYKAGGEIGVRINESFLLQSGLYAMKYDQNFGYRPYYDAVTYVNASYRINSWLSLGAYGRYSAGEKYNATHGSLMLSPFVPHSGYGISATTMFNDVIGLQGVIGREFNPFKGKWETTYDIFPIIDFNKLFK